MRPIASLQRIYDEGYLKCSAAIDYEGQGEAAEAMKCWCSAVDQIRRQSSEAMLPDYSLLSEAEQSLVDSLRLLERQAQERVDLLHTLPVSRRDGVFTGNNCASGAETVAIREGWAGGETRPAITYSEFSYSLPSSPPHGQAESPSPFMEESGHNELIHGDASSAWKISISKHSASSVSSVKHFLRPTLRTGHSSEHRKRNDNCSLNEKPTPEQLGANRAATMAWSTLSHNKPGGSLRSPPVRVTLPVSHTPAKVVDEHQNPRIVPVQWDRNSRRLVPQRQPNDSMPTSPRIKDSDSSFAASDVRRVAKHTLPRGSPSLSLNAAASALGRSLELGSKPSQAKSSSFGQPPIDAASTAMLSGVERASQTASVGYSSAPYQQQMIMTSGQVPSYYSPDSPTKRISNMDMSASNVRKPALSWPKRNAAGDLGQTKQITRNSTTLDGQLAQDIPHFLADVQQKVALIGESGRQYASETPERTDDKMSKTPWSRRKQQLLKCLPPSVDIEAAKHIMNEIIVHGDVVHWGDIAGLEQAKKALQEAVVYPFLRPDLFKGLREPATGMLLFGPPGTGKTMLARAVATESESTFFSISASSLTSKYLGESEKLVRALFNMAKLLAPSVIFVDEIDSILSQRSASGEHEATRRIKAEFLIQWSDLQRAAVGQKHSTASHNGDPSRVLVLAATNLPWAIDEAARRRFVRRQYIPLPEAKTRTMQFKALLGEQKHILDEHDILKLVDLTDGFSSSDITALAKDAAMGPLRSLGEALLMMRMDDIRPMELSDFEASLQTIRPSVGKSGLKEYEGWAKEFGERGG